MMFTEVERNFFCLKPGGGDYCWRPKGHADECSDLYDTDDVVAFQDAREGEVLEDIRERIILNMPDYGFDGVQINAVLEALEMELHRTTEQEQHDD
jgi:hypothetical protein